MFNSPALAVLHEQFHRLIKLLNLQRLLQNRDRTDLENPIEDLTFRVTCDHDNVEVRINLLGSPAASERKFTVAYCTQC
jgi:hypothetical protein